MKAISPMIAVVLLIGFTVAVGGILSVWLSTLTTSQSTTVSTGTERQVKCAPSILSIKEVRYNATNPCSTCNISYYVNTTVRYESGTEGLSPNVTVDVIYKGAINTSVGVISLSPGQTFTNATNVTRWTRTLGTIEAVAPEIVRARTFCQTSTPIVAECKSGEPCMVAVT